MAAVEKWMLVLAGGRAAGGRWEGESGRVLAAGPTHLCFPETGTRSRSLKLEVPPDHTHVKSQ